MKRYMLDLTFVVLAGACSRREAAPRQDARTAPPPAAAPAPTVESAAPSEAGATVSAAPTPPDAGVAGPDALCPPSMRFVPGGSYSYLPARRVAVNSLCVNRTEVTVADYLDCVRRGRCEPAGTWSHGCNAGVPNRSLHPINCVNLEQASTYCRSHGWRLPTDPEWEWIARGGPIGNRFPWGMAPPRDQLCWSGSGQREGTCEVEAFPSGATPQGILDMAGNVDEWTSSPSTLRDDSNVTRGGDWIVANPDVLTVDVQWQNIRESGAEVVGFRCVVTSASVRRK